VTRCFFAVTACCALVGTVLEFWVRGSWQQLYFFTTESNLILGITTLLLALRLDRRGDIFHSLRLAALIDIVITGTVFHLLLGGGLAGSGVGGVANLLQHTLNPVLAVLGWLLFGPAGSVTIRRTLLAAVVPLAYLAVTLVHGALTGWYPYRILDVTALGYGGVAVRGAAVAVLFLLIAAGLALIDRRRVETSIL
jgi:hypothetical protein